MGGQRLLSTAKGPADGDYGARKLDKTFYSNTTNLGRLVIKILIYTPLD